MIPTTRTRHRPNETTREAIRLANAIAVTLGQGVRVGRRRRRLTQAELAARVGVRQAWISRIELGKGHGAPLRLWIALGDVLGQPLAVSFSRPLGDARQTTDAGHLAMQEHLLGLARAAGRTASFELPTRPADPSRSIDVCVRDARLRVLIVAEAWNTFADVGAAVRATHRKLAEAADLASTIDDGPPYRVAAVWVVRDNAANRSIVDRYPHIMRTVFPGSSRAWVRALTRPVAPPAEAGLIWFDGATNRLRERRRQRP